MNERHLCLYFNLWKIVLLKGESEVQYPGLSKSDMLVCTGIASH